VVMREKLIDPGTLRWQTEMLFSVKIGDFGFAKQIQATASVNPDAHPSASVGAGIKVYNRLTPGMLTENYAAPECMQHTFEGGAIYDAFKADSYSLGVVAFVMLTLSFPDKDGNNSAQKRDDRRPDLSKDALSFVNNLLAPDPTQRLGMKQACCHQWLHSHAGLSSTCSEEAVYRTADWRIRQSSIAAQTLTNATLQNPSISVLLALHRGLVLVQRERGMACCTLARTPSFDNFSISCGDQFYMHVQLTEKRICQAKDLLQSCASKHWRLHTMKVLDALIEDLKIARSSLSASREQSNGQDACQPTQAVFNAVFTAYNGLCFKWINMIADALEALCPGSAEMKRASLRYRLFTGAAEQLGRERAFVCGHWQTSSDSSPITPRSPSSRGDGLANQLSREELRRLAEILGARKVLLGTAVQDNSATSGDVLAPFAGLLTTLVGEDTSPLLGVADMRTLESIEERVLLPKGKDGVLPIEEWFQTLTRLMNEIHSRIAITLVGDVHHGFGDASVSLGTDSLELGPSSGMPPCRKWDGCACRAGLKKVLQSVVDRL